MRYDEFLDNKMNDVWLDVMAKYYVVLGTENSKDSEEKREAMKDFKKAVNYFTGLELLTYKDLLNGDEEISNEFERAKKETLRCIYEKVKETEA